MRLNDLANACLFTSEQRSWSMRAHTHSHTRTHKRMSYFARTDDEERLFQILLFILVGTLTPLLGKSYNFPLAWGCHRQVEAGGFYKTSLNISSLIGEFKLIIVDRIFRGNATKIIGYFISGGQRPDSLQLYYQLTSCFFSF